MNSLSALPQWVSDIVKYRQEVSNEEAMRLCIEVATASALHSGGPFGAILLNANQEIVSVGWNHVVLSSDSTAHAEVDCLRKGQQLLGTHDLKTAGEFTLISSTAPCIQCFGAIWWSGLSAVVVGASKEDAENTGFDEGPVNPSLWEAAAKQKGISYTNLTVPDLDVNKPFREFKKIGGVLY